MTRPPAGAADSRGPGTASAVAIIPIAANPHAAFMIDVAPPCLVRLRHVPQTRRSSALSVSLTGRPDVRVSSLRTDEMRSGRATIEPVRNERTQREVRREELSPLVHGPNSRRAYSRVGGSS